MTLTVTDLDNGKTDLETWSTVVNSESETETTTRLGDTVKTRKGLTDEFETAIAAVGANSVGNYEDDPTLTNINDVAWYATGSVYYKLKDGVSRPYDIDSTTYPDPEDDPNIQQYNQRDQVTSIAALQARGTETGYSVYLSIGGRSGWFEWDSSDLSTEVAADTQQGIYIAADSDLTGASGAWVRTVSGDSYQLAWFGAIADDTQDDRSAVVGAIAAVSALGGGVIKAPKSYYLSGIDRIQLASNVFIDMCFTGKFRKDDLVPEAGFYAYSYFHFDACEYAGILNGTLEGINYTEANTDYTTGVSISVGGSCKYLWFDNLVFDEAWTGMLLGANLSAADYSQYIYCGTLYGLDCEQTLVASAVKNVEVDLVTNERIDKYAQRCVFLQSVQDCHIKAIRTLDIVSTSFYAKAFSTIFPNANNVIDSIQSIDAAGSVNVACSIHTTDTVGENTVDVTKHLTIGSVNTQNTGAAVQIIATNDNQLQDICVGKVNGSTENAAVDIRLNGNKVSDIRIGDVLHDAENSAYGIIVDNTSSAHTEYIKDNIVIASYKQSGKADTADISLSYAEGLTIKECGNVRSYDGSSYTYSPMNITTANCSCVELGCNDTSNFTSVSDHLLTVNGKLFGSTQTIEVNGSTGDDANVGNSSNPVATIQRAIDLIPEECKTSLTVNIANGSYADFVRITDKKFTGDSVQFNFNSSSITYMQVHNCHARMGRFSINDVVCNSDSINNIQFEGCKGITVDGMSTSASASSGIESRNSELYVKNSSFGSSLAVCINSNLQSNVLSENNSGNGTSYGLAARLGSVVAKNGTQPTGTVADEAQTGGSIIRS